MVHRNSQPAGQRRFLVDIHRAMAAYEAGESQIITKTTYNQLQKALEHAHAILGPEGDRGCVTQPAPGA